MHTFGSSPQTNRSNLSNRSLCLLRFLANAAAVELVATANGREREWKNATKSIAPGIGSTSSIIDAMFDSHALKNSSAVMMPVNSSAERTRGTQSSDRRPRVFLFSSQVNSLAFPNRSSTFWIAFFKGRKAFSLIRKRKQMR